MLLDYLLLLFMALFTLGLHHSHHWPRHVLTILQRLLTRVQLGLLLSLLVLWDLRLVLVNLLHLLRKLLNKHHFTCILSNFYFFFIHYYPPILAPSPPNFVHYFSVSFFLSSDLLSAPVVFFCCNLINYLYLYFSRYNYNFSCNSLSFLSF